MHRAIVFFVLLAIFGAANAIRLIAGGAYAVALIDIAAVIGCIWMIRRGIRMSKAVDT